jgi:hypothetical protein
MKTPRKVPAILTLAAATALVLSACIPSIEPYFTAADVANDPRLAGEWDDGEGTTWLFGPAEDGACTMRLTERKDDATKTGTFHAQLFKLGETHFIDIVAADVDFAESQVELVAMSVFPGHLLMRVHQFEPTLKLSLFDWDWLQKHLEARPDALAHRKEGDRIVLTARTADLQAFVLAHLATGELFGGPDDAGELKRVVPAAEAEAAP